MLFYICPTGFLVEFFSYPVIAGFTSAAALTIAASQFKTILGIPGKANEFLDALISVFENISETQKWDAVLGFSTFIALILTRVNSFVNKYVLVVTNCFSVAITKVW